MPITRILSPRGSETERCDRRSGRWKPFPSARNKTKKRHIIFFNINPWQTHVTKFNFSTYLQDCRSRSSSIPNPKIDYNSRKEAQTSWKKTWNTWFVITLRSWRRTDAGRIATNPRSKSLFLIVETYFIIVYTLGSGEIQILWKSRQQKKNMTNREKQTMSSKCEEHIRL